MQCPGSGRSCITGWGIGNPHAFKWYSCSPVTRYIIILFNYRYNQVALYGGFTMRQIKHQLRLSSGTFAIRTQLVNWIFISDPFEALIPKTVQNGFRRCFESWWRLKNNAAMNPPRCWECKKRLQTLHHRFFDNIHPHTSPGIAHRHCADKESSQHQVQTVVFPSEQGYFIGNR